MIPLGDLCDDCWGNYANLEYSLRQGNAPGWERRAHSSYKAIGGIPDTNWPPRAEPDLPADPVADTAAYALSVRVPKTFPLQDRSPHGLYNGNWRHYDLMIESPGPEAVYRLIRAGFEAGALTQSQGLYSFYPELFGGLTVHDRRGFRIQEWNIPTPAAWEWWSIVTDPIRFQEQSEPCASASCILAKQDRDVR